MNGTTTISTRATTTALSSTISEQDFTTPDRSTAKALSSAAVTGSHPEEKKEDVLTGQDGEATNVRSSATLVTPLDAFSTAAARKEAAAATNTNDKQGRFHAKKSTKDHDTNKNTTGVEATTLRTVGSDEGDSSTSSPTASKRGLVSRRGGRCPSPGRSLLAPPLNGSKRAADTAAAVLEFKTFEKKGNLIKGDPDASLNVVTSSANNSQTERRKHLSNGKTTSVTLSKKTTMASSTFGTSHKKSNSVTFSPVPPSKNNTDKCMKTPTKSPTGGRFTSLPTLDDDTLGSPGAIFLSPTRTPTYFDRKTTAKDKSDLNSDAGILKPPLTPRTPKKDIDRERFLATPTDFAFDYGKPASSGSLLESSNVLAWLHSPTVNGLFSPGGLGSTLNTPRAALPKTPHTPTFSTSFFFSDVAGLPRGGESSSPKPGVSSGASETEKRNGNSRGSNNIICISPLSSYKGKGNASGPSSPKINYKEMFASPAERSGMAMLGAAKARAGVQKGGNLDVVHLAERDLMEDEDLSVLLQLASNTPRPGTSEKSQSTGAEKVDGSKVFRKNGESENLPSLQLPIIGSNDKDGKGARLTRKTHSRDHNDMGDDGGVRPMTQTSGGTVGASLNQKNVADDAKKPPTTGSMHPSNRKYPPFSSHFPHHESPYYPSMHPGMAHSGSMRVVVGGPPSNRGKSTSESQRVRPYPLGPRGEYPPPPYPPPPSHYTHHRGVPPPPHMHPHYGRYPPHPSHSHSGHRHVPLYATHPKSKATPSTSAASKKPAPKPAPVTKQSLKRPASSTTSKATSSAKKSKKSGGTKKKNRSPQLVDKAERQKAAATIQAVNQASGGKNDKAAALAAAILRGVTMRPSGKWQAQLYFAGKSRYIGVFDTREKAALAYEIAREKLKSEKSNAEGGVLSPKRTESAVNAARKAAFEGVNERDPRFTGT